MRDARLDRARERFCPSCAGAGCCGVGAEMPLGTRMVMLLTQVRVLAAPVLTVLRRGLAVEVLVVVKRVLRSSGVSRTASTTLVSVVK